MIQLFNIPHHTIDTSRFSNLLHDKIVREFEEKFAEYVGAKYAVSFNSATSAIFLIFKYLSTSKRAWVPSIIPPVVPNAIINAGCKCSFTNNSTWVGGWYRMITFEEFDIVDSAQDVTRGNFEKVCEPEDLMIFSFYPTKPIGGCDGGMVVSDDRDKIERLREASMNGMSTETNNWERKLSSIGHKMYMNSIQAYVALQNLYKLDDKKDALSYLRKKYNEAFGLENTSDHLYRVRVDDNRRFIEFAKKRGVVCGVHYEALHDHLLYGGDGYKDSGLGFEYVTRESKQMVSIPFHENLSLIDIGVVIETVNEYKRETKILS